jgi:peptide/nickel transport system ATP-binding protein
MALLFITHDISVVVQTCDTVAVMYGGLVMERGPVRDVFRTPVHPYTMGLRNAFPTLAGAMRELVSIAGAPPNLLAPPPGCRFAERCPFATDRCREEAPALVEVAPGRLAACHYPDQAAEFREQAALEPTWRRVASAGRHRRADPHPAAGDARRLAGRGRSPGAALPGRARLVSLRRRRGPERVVHALDGVSFEVRRGEILGLAGESGSGKTTTGETLVRLQVPTAGHIRFQGEAVEHLRGARLRAFRRHAQMVFQDPYETLNPRLTVEDIVGEPLTIHRLARGDERRERVLAALERGGLRPPADYLERFPHELSGGQRQRVAIARAIVLEPDFLVADEPVSMLDVSIRAGVLNLLRRFRDEDGISIVYVSHDLPTIRYVADRTAIMYLGQIVEIGPTEDVIQGRRHPYTQLLLEASPEPDPDVVKPALEAAARSPAPSTCPTAAASTPAARSPPSAAAGRAATSRPRWRRRGSPTATCRPSAPPASRGWTCWWTATATKPRRAAARGGDGHRPPLPAARRDLGAPRRRLAPALRRHGAAAADPDRPRPPGRLRARRLRRRPAGRLRRGAIRSGAWNRRWPPCTSTSKARSTPATSAVGRWPRAAAPAPAACGARTPSPSPPRPTATRWRAAACAS